MYVLTTKSAKDAKRISRLRSFRVFRSMNILLAQIRAAVIRPTFWHLKRELRIAGNIKGLAFAVSREALFTLQLHIHRAAEHFHHFRSFGAELVVARLHKAERLLRAIGEKHCAASDLATEINIGLLDRGYVFK